MITYKSSKPIKIIFLCIYILTATIFLVACNSSESIGNNDISAEEIVLEGKTMGTLWRVNAIGINKKYAAELSNKIQYQLDMDDQVLSTYKKDSMLMNFNTSRSTSPLMVNKAIADIVTEALYVGHKTYNAMDITIGPIVNLWGFGPDKQPKKIPNNEQINSILVNTGLKHLSVINKFGQQYLQKDIPDLFIDLSTLGEGYAADHLANLMMQEGISRYLITVGGSLIGRGTNAIGKPWRIAIQKPTDQQQAIQAIVNIDGGYSISTSGSYRNYYELENKRISHIIDPRTGNPITHNLVSVTVIASSALEADAWDTGLMVLGTVKAKEVIKQEGLAAYLITNQDNVFKTWMSPQFATFLVKE